MFSHSTGFFTLTLILQTVMILGLIKSDCPKSCKCDPKKKTVECTDGFWKQLPHPVPEGTNSIRVSGYHFKKLIRPSSCHGYSQLTTLVLGNRISAIAFDAFKCMPKLQSLDLYYNKLTEKALPKLCTIKNLMEIKLHGNRIRIYHGTLDCVGFLEHLSSVILNRNNGVDGPINETLKPLKNVSGFIGLVKCGISLMNYGFAGFKVQILDLSDNGIEHVPEHAFGNMLNLTTLYLGENKISETHEWLGKLSLQSIGLAHNNFIEVPFISKTVKYVFLSNNLLRKLSRDSVANLDNLQELDISCNIFHIERYAFHNLPNLENLAISMNFISADNLKSIFLDLVHCPLRTFHLQTSRNLNILNQTFEYFKPNNLEELDFSSSSIHTIVPGTFENLKALQKLDLSYVGITELIENVFKGLTNLTTLNLSGNKLIYFDWVECGLQHSPLSDLVIVKSHLSTLNLLDLSTLTKLQLSYNDLQHMSFSTLKGLTSLQYLDMSHNDMTEMYNIFPEFSNLTHLDLSSNPGIQKSLKGCFRKMYNLQTWKLSGTLIGSLDPKEQIDLWKELHNLESLDISSCQIDALVRGMFSGLTNLRMLHASSNRIPFLEPLAFQNTSRLIELYLDTNFITHINWESLVYLPNLRLLSLANNPLLCTCDVLWILKAVTTLDLVYMPDKHGAHLVCKHPQEVQNIRVIHLKLKISDCEDSWLDILKPIFGGLGGFLAMFLLYISWYYRWRIRYTIFLAKAGLGRYEELKDDREYVYDAFVAYCATDLPWVKEQMLPNIDAKYIGPKGYKLCLHHRDWLAGVDIVENIVKSIAESRRTIIVLSKDFATSYWCQFELAMAHMRLYAEGSKKSRLLVILLEDIPASLLTPRLIHILTSKSYINWPQDAESQRLFWETLHKSLAKGLLYT